jgi:hypothetical protein
MAGGAHVVGICPDLLLTAWAQPWSPLVLLWDIVWYPINHDNGGAPLWSFDGSDYQWNGEGFDQKAPVWEYMGMIFMTPQASFNFRAQMEKFILENPNAEGVKKLYDFIEQIDQWDFLSQSLAGLSPLMGLRDTNPNVSASLDQQQFFNSKTLADLVGSSATYAPSPGQPQPPPFQPWPPSGFQNWRAGQFVFRRLYVVDRFGQTCEVVNSTTQSGFAPVLSPSLVPQHPVIPNQPSRFVQLVPRLLQPGRLNFDFVSCSDDQYVLGYEPGVNPICAWLLHNLLDESIAAYDNRGDILGGAWLATNDQNQQFVNWQAAPGSPYKTINDLLDNPDLAHLGQTLLALKELGPAAFQSFIETIDEASWTISGGETTSDIGLTLLAGRPVAMARARLLFELDGPSITDPSWRYTFSPASNPATGWDFNIRLGETGMHQDGLIGYFVGSDYNQLFAPDVPDNVPDPNYVIAVGNGSSLSLPFDGTTARYVTLLMDPRSVTHATTGILPVINIGIPQTFVGEAFARMDVTFTVGPLLSDTITPVGPEGPEAPSIVMPRPSLKDGSWSWQQYDGENWITIDVTPSTPTAQFSNVPAKIRMGLLRLTGAIKQGSGVGADDE